MGEDLITISNGLVHSTSNVKAKSVVLLKKILGNIDSTFFKEQSVFESTFSTLLSQIILPLDGLLPNFKISPNSLSQGHSTQPRSFNSHNGLSEKEVELVLNILQSFESIKWESSALLKKHITFLFHVISCSFNLPSVHQNIHTQSLKSFTALIKSSEFYQETLKDNEQWRNTSLSALTSLSITIFSQAVKEDVSSALFSLFILSSKFDTFSSIPSQLAERDTYLANSLRDSLKSVVIKNQLVALQIFTGLAQKSALDPNDKKLERTLQVVFF
eukprot:TRINITY_DN16914_c0_g1_i1.p1 TRINITY_DN16914_c0_g1~~TRINITY_DN16914_c0_g1_i1.p1  ORF type:complete len:294 (+),score=92.22 TRINITY_DN16914_c0_g1_i1:65-883(+)